MAATNDDTKYALGSVLNHVLMHQTIIGLEAIQQFEMAGDDPGRVVGCTGGGRTSPGIAFPVHRPAAARRQGKKRRIVAVELAACPSLTRGKYAYDFGDTAHLTPLTKMHTLGSDLHAAGLPRRRPALPRHGAAGVAPRSELNLIEAAASPPDRLLRGRRAVCAQRRHRAGARGEPRRQAAIEGRRCAASARAEQRDDPVQPQRATATSTWPRTATTSPASWSTSPTTRRSWRWRSPTGCRRYRLKPGPPSPRCRPRRHRASRPSAPDALDQHRHAGLAGRLMVGGHGHERERADATSAAASSALSRAAPSITTPAQPFLAAAAAMLPPISAAQRAAAVDDEHAALAGRFERGLHRRVVLEAL